jgi:hypothetical protein
MAGIEMFVAILLLAMLGVLATTVGVDSSDSSKDPRRPAIGIS